MSFSGPVLGIDFGTCHASAAVLTSTHVELVLDAGEPQVPSVVYFPEKGAPVVGRQALVHGVWDPGATVASVKRLLGRRHDDPEVRAIDAGTTLRLSAGHDGQVLIRIRDEEVTPSHVAAAILRRLKGLAEKRFGGSIGRAVFTVPVESTPAYLGALRRAAELAGLDVVRWLAEPIAGALAYQAHRGAEHLLVCDLGGGTSDASLLALRGGELRPLGSAGDAFLGGNDLDHVLGDGVAGAVYAKQGVDLRKDPVVWNQLIRRSEWTKRQLSSADAARLQVEEAYVRDGKTRNVDFRIERRWAEMRWAPLAVRVMALVDALMVRVQLLPEHIDRVLLLGGTSLVPLIRRTFAARFAGVVAPADAHLAVVRGAAILAATLPDHDHVVVGLGAAALRR